MSIKCILVPLSGTPLNEVVSKTANLAAKNIRVEIQAIYAHWSAAREASLLIGGANDLLVVVGPGVANKRQAHEMAEAALSHTGRQVLLTPAVVPQALGDRVLVAWNRSPQAGRAVAQAMPFLERAKHVSIFHVQTGAKPGPSPGRLRHYLGLHGVAAEISEIAPDHRTVGEQILDQAHDDGADLIVMGAYSKSRLRERLLGGVTQFVFSTADIPVLMTH